MPLSLDDLETHLFECADIIRDAVDPTDYKEYILPLVYYKSISDEFEKQYAENVEEYGEDFARRNDLYEIPIVPEGYLWDDLRAVSDNVDQALNDAFEALAEENPDLEDVVLADYIDADALDDDRLGKLVEHLSKYDLDRDSVPPDMLGEAYMDLVRHFAEEEGKSGGQFFTPPHIVNLCVRLVDEFEDGDTFHDPTVGSGGMLIEAARYYREEQGGDPGKLTYTGQEINPDIAAIARMNLSIHGLDGEIEREDSLLNPAFTDEENSELTRFDRVLANFPFSANWAKSDLQDDPYGRFDWHEKLPRADRGDYAFIMHMARQLKRPERDGSGGKAAIVIPNGVLFRKHESRYREPMLENDMVEAIVGLPENLFQNNSIPSAVLVLNTDKAAEREGEIQFIHAADEAFYEELSNQNELTEAGLDHIVENFREWTTEERVSRTVSLDEIRENDYNLNVALYVDTTEPEDDLNIHEELTKLRELQTEREKIEAQMESHMQALEYQKEATLDESVVESDIDDGERATSRFWGTIPDGWEIVGGSEVYDVNPNPAPDEEPNTYIEMDALDTELPWPRYFGKRNASEYSGKTFTTGDILFARITPCTENGKAALVPEMETKVGIGSTEYAVLSPKTERINPWYLYYVGKSHPVHNYAVSRMRGSTGRQRVPFSVFRRELDIALPPRDEQQKIATVLYTIDRAIQILSGFAEQTHHYDSEVESLRRLKRALIQDLLSGTVRTTNTNIEVPDEITQYG